MPTLRRIALLGAILTLTILSLAPTAAATDAAAGKVRFVQPAESDFDRYTRSPSPAEQGWMASHYWRMRTYAPYFDSRLSWFPNAWAYKDLYAIYTTDPIVEQHPEWILKDRAGRRLYIPFGCRAGTCPQYAGDVGNPAFRAYWIQQAKLKLAPGYRGLFVDDVNMELRVGDGSGIAVAPVDPRSGAAMSLSTWRRYVAEFTEAIRSALPGKEIVHNAIWFSGFSDPYVQRELRSADVIELERGVNDSGITGGGGRFGYETFLSRIDWIHSQGKSVVLDGRPERDSEREYSLATYLLTNANADGIGDPTGGRPDSFWPGYGIDLGVAAGPRYLWRGMLRRDFARGYVLVNQPGEPTRSVSLAGAYGLDGKPHSSASLAGGEGAVLIGTSPASSARRLSTRTLVVPRPNPKVRSKARSSRRASRRRRMRRAVLVRGRVKRAAGGRVRVTVQRKARGRWVRVRSARTRIRAGGRFKKLFRGMPRARYRVRAKYLGSSTSAPSKSRARKFRVRH